MKKEKQNLEEILHTSILLCMKGSNKMIFENKKICLLLTLFRQVIYLLNPFTISSCFSNSTIILSNLSGDLLIDCLLSNFNIDTISLSNLECDGSLALACSIVGQISSTKVVGSRASSWSAGNIRTPLNGFPLPKTITLDILGSTSSIDSARNSILTSALH